ncbi:PREDICTED: uncharacterized protein LOC109580596 [Amphimedon queenslandica]|uniref:Uncharacterized protein n=2 Tax=Amphimedon queenslandica TaxID=400682 RepID=A0AAN0IYG9_AMPQE|nr:PREDICTED: uncharacterized protein LOC109580596 [Amphimedon queenslandica]|eukprot:XP_019849498.1 PREDICTED: uncharacterized protein LOC109580596 [Amphimedon queenslandica]
MNEDYDVNVTLNGKPSVLGIIRLTRNNVEIQSGGGGGGGGRDGLQLIIRLSRIKSIQIHQPIFSANYIDIEYTSDNGENAKAIVVFNRGGATEFAKAFFRATEGVVTDDTGHQTVSGAEERDVITNEKKTN